MLFIYLKKPRVKIKRIHCQKLSVEALTYPDDKLQGLICLDAAYDAGKRANGAPSAQVGTSPEGGGAGNTHL